MEEASWTQTYAPNMCSGLGQCCDVPLGHFSFIVTALLLGRVVPKDSSSIGWENTQMGKGGMLPFIPEFPDIHLGDCPQILSSGFMI